MSVIICIHTLQTVSKSSNSYQQCTGLGKIQGLFLSDLAHPIRIGLTPALNLNTTRLGLSLNLTRCAEKDYSYVTSDLPSQERTFNDYFSQYHHCMRLLSIRHITKFPRLISPSRPAVQRRFVPIMSSPAGPLKRKADAFSAKSAESKKPKTNGSITSFFGAPKSTSSGPTNGAATVATPKFVKAKWVEKLTPEQKSLLKLEIDTLDESWLAHLKDEIVTPSFLGLKRFLKSEIESGKKIFPPMEDVYSWSVRKS